jgi:hypothetical protein
MRRFKPRISLYCDRGDHKGEWRFEARTDGMDVVHPDGEVVSWFAHEEADGRFKLPSFWQSVKYITFKLDSGKFVEFEPDRRDVAKVRRYLDDALLWLGEDAIAGLRHSGLLFVITGPTCILFGVAAFILLYGILDLRGRGAAYPGAILIFLGLGQTGLGIRNLARSGKLRRRLEEMEDEEDPPPNRGQER